jgi:O-antigen chain-terminating methyltransferase
VTEQHHYQPKHDSNALRTAYTTAYYLEDCGGYETYRCSGGKQIDARLECMARLARIHSGTAPLRILDLGCGRGELTYYFAQAGHHVTAIDYAPEALALAEACFIDAPITRRRVLLHQASVTDAVFYHGKYDVVLASDVIEHLAPAEVDTVYRLVSRHLAPDGYFLLHTFPNRWYYQYRWPVLRRQAVAQGQAEWPLNPRSHYEQLMHINEQSPRIMRRQLGQFFQQVLLWAGDHERPERGLIHPFSVHEWRDAPSIFAIASAIPMAVHSVVTTLQTPLSVIHPSHHTMLLDNQSGLDIETLNTRIQARLQQYQQNESLADQLPAFDPQARPQPTIVDKQPVPAKLHHVTTLSALMALEDSEFIDHAHWLLLGRQADPSEYEATLNRIRSGVEKGQVLAWICRFPNAPARNRSIYRQLRANRLKHWLARKPFLGYSIETLFAWLRAYPFRLLVNARLNYFYRLTQQHEQRLQQLTSHFEQLESHAEQLHATTHQHSGQLQQQHEILEQNVDHVKDLEQQVEQIQHGLAQHTEQFEQQIHINNDYVTQLQQNQSTIATLKETIQQYEAHHRTLNDTIDVLSHDLQLMKARLTEYTTSLSLDFKSLASVSTPADGASSRPIEAPAANDLFYVAFEDRFRGEATVITERLQYYMPLLNAVQPLTAGQCSVDLGCGRGEWLTLLQQRGIEAIGLDTNFHQIKYCRQAGHHVIVADALTWLQTQPAQSLGLITAFHFIEHVAPAYVHALLRAALRALSPGGLLILETPNPENLLVASHSFYMDPTHQRPIPPELLKFIIDYHGFEHITVHRLHAFPNHQLIHEATETAAHCNALLYGAQDYAITGFKPF